MKSQLVEEKLKTAKTSAERWVCIWPDRGDGYQLYDALQERNIGRILFDSEGYWIYDGHVLTLDEQEEIAGFISGNHKEMNDLISSIK